MVLMMSVLWHRISPIHPVWQCLDWLTSTSHRLPFYLCSVLLVRDMLPSSTTGIPASLHFSLLQVWQVVQNCCHLQRQWYKWWTHYGATDEHQQWFSSLGRITIDHKNNSKHLNCHYKQQLSFVWTWFAFRTLWWCDNAGNIFSIIWTGSWGGGYLLLKCLCLFLQT